MELKNPGLEHPKVPIPGKRSEKESLHAATTGRILLARLLEEMSVAAEEHQTNHGRRAGTRVTVGSANCLECKFALSK